MNKNTFFFSFLDESRSALEIHVPGNAESLQGLRTRKEHYRPKRGVQIALSGYVSVC